MEGYSRLYVDLLSLYKKSKSGHIGGGVSVLPALYVLLDKIFDDKNDMLVLSKGHNAAALYCALSFFGFISKEELQSFYSDGTRLGGHPPKNLVPFAPFATGSLGHGASLSSGLALGKKFKKKSGEIFCFCGDGEWQEGSCWEALIFSVKHRIDNLTIIVDFNDWQGFGSVSDVADMDYEGLGKRFDAFGADVVYCDGNDFTSIADSFMATSHNRPKIIMMKTRKGKGIPGLENTLASHYLPITQDLYDAAVCGMEGNFEK